MNDELLTFNIMVSSNKSIITLYKSLGNLKDDFRNYNLYHFVVSKVRGNNVLDVGSGNGFLINLLEKNGKKTMGIEPNQELIDMAKQKFPQLRLICNRAEDLENINSRFSAITMVDVLEHIKDDNLQLQKIYRCLIDGGQLILVVPAFPFLYGARDKAQGHYRRYTKKELIQKLLNNNFRIMEIRYWNMLGFLPYFFYQKLLNKNSNFYLRTERSKNVFEKPFVLILHLWYKYIENNINLGFGLSLVCVAEKSGQEDVVKTI